MDEVTSFQKWFRFTETRHLEWCRFICSEKQTTTVQKYFAFVAFRQQKSLP
jgi:hypothetical protein